MNKTPGVATSSSKIILNKLVEINIASYLMDNPYLVTSVHLSPLYVGQFDEMLKKDLESVTSTLKSIMVNVSGNLLMFQPDLDSLLNIPEDLKRTKPYSSLPPICLSNGVETCWIVCHGASAHAPLLNKYLNYSLWLNCGSYGVKVWLPLAGDDELHVQQSNRVILSFPIRFYPLGLLVNESLLVGATSDLVCANNSNVAYCQIQKSTQLFMPFVLEGLLRKNLRTDARKITIGYAYLPYFLHILELLVHKISEEEATASPDDDHSARILPQVGHQSIIILFQTQTTIILIVSTFKISHLFII